MLQTESPPKFISWCSSSSMSLFRDDPFKTVIKVKQGNERRSLTQKYLLFLKNKRPEVCEQKEGPCEGIEQTK